MAAVTSPRERLRLTILVSVLVVVAAAALVYSLREAAGGGGSAGASDLDYAAHDLPLLAMGSPTPGGTGAASDANPFAFRPPPTPTRNLTPPPTPRPTLPPRPTPTPRFARGLGGEAKPPPPPFNREYIGHLGPTPTLVAAFRKGDGDTAEIEVATVGQVIDGIYIVRAIGLESVTIGFIGYDASEDTSVPLSDK